MDHTGHTGSMGTYIMDSSMYITQYAGQGSVAYR